MLYFLSSFLISLQLSTSYAEEVFSSYIQIDEYQTKKMAWVVYERSDILKSKIQFSSIEDELTNILNPSILICIKKYEDDKGILSFKSLESCGLKTLLDLNTLIVRITVNKKSRKENKLAVSGYNLNSSKRVYKPSFLSGYINLRSLQEINNFDGSFNQRPLNTSAEGVFNIKGLALESRFTHQQEDGTNPSRLTRDYSKITYDIEKSMTRITLGDINLNTRGFQDRLSGLGISINKEFSINPQFFRSSFKEYNLFLDRTSTVEIYINGKLVKTQRAPKGPLLISDFPFISGENSVQIKLIDDFGTVKEVDFSNISDSKLLSKGVSDYSFNYLYPRSDDLTTTSINESYDLDSGIFSGFYHKGIKDNFVLGAESQIGPKGGLLGFEATFGNKLGISKFNFASSSIDDVRPLNKTSLSDLTYALRVENESLLMKKGSLSNFRLSSAVEVRSKGFQKYDSPEENQKLILRSSVAQNFRNSIRGSLGLSKSWNHDSSENRTLVFSNFGWNFLKNWDFSSAIKINLNNSDDTTLLFSISWSTPVQNKQWLSTYDPQNNTGSSEFTYFPVRDTNNLKVRFGGNTALSSDTVNGGFEYLNQRLELKSNYSTSIRDAGNSLSTASFSAGIGLAFSNYHFALTRPIANSFAIIGMSKKPFGLNVPIDRYGRTKRAEINLFGPAVISTLAPYFTDQISVDGSSLPYGLTVKNENFNFRPTYRSGAYLDVAVDSKTSIIGSVRRADKGDIKYLTGKLIEVGKNGKQKIISEFFTGSDGSFTIEGVRNKKYFIEFYDQNIKFKRIGITVNKSLGFFEIKKPLLLSRGI